MEKRPLVARRLKAPTLEIDREKFVSCAFAREAFTSASAISSEAMNVRYVRICAAVMVSPPRAASSAAMPVALTLLRCPKVTGNAVAMTSNRIRKLVLNFVMIKKLSRDLIIRLKRRFGYECGGSLFGGRGFVSKVA